ncbi:MAG: serine peptidase [Gammaproteobacteria bacterium]|nr:serine peptidase [Gammaproteobacteria bacterium]
MICTLASPSALRALIAGCVAWLAAGTASADLPDFTELVEDNAAAVVNISTVGRAAARSGSPRSREDELNEFFRRFFGPDGRRGGPQRQPRSLGSGFVISEDGYLLTNNHVVDGADEILVRFSDRRELEAELVGADPRSDLALLKVDADNLPTVRMGKSSKLDVGEWVLAIGSPFGFDYTVTAGIVSAKGRSLPTEDNENYVPFIQTDVAINPGNSGGPLFNLDGEVVGINSQIYSNSGGSMGISFAIPIDVAMEVVDQIKTEGRVSRGWLGVVIQEVNRDLAESFQLDRPRGALVVNVLEGSPAEKGGILAGDVIVEFNGQPIGLSSELPHLVGRAPAGSNATLKVVREGRQIKLRLDIGELADAPGGGGFLDQTDAGSSSLGLKVEPVDPRAIERLRIVGGVRVVEVTGPAEQAGLRKGDIITRINNKEINSIESFSEIVGELPSGRSVPVLVIRGQVPTFLPLRVP